MDEQQRMASEALVLFAGFGMLALTEKQEAFLNSVSITVEEFEKARQSRISLYRWFIDQSQVLAKPEADQLSMIGLIKELNKPMTEEIWGAYFRILNRLKMSALGWHLPAEVKQDYVQTFKFPTHDHFGNRLLAVGDIVSISSDHSDLISRSYTRVVEKDKAIVEVTVYFEMPSHSKIEYEVQIRLKGRFSTSVMTQKVWAIPHISSTKLREKLDVLTKEKGKYLLQYWIDKKDVYLGIYIPPSSKEHTLSFYSPIGKIPSITLPKTATKNGRYRYYKIPRAPKGKKIVATVHIPGNSSDQKFTMKMHR